MLHFMNFFAAHFVDGLSIHLNVNSVKIKVATIDKKIYNIRDRLS